MKKTLFSISALLAAVLLPMASQAEASYAVYAGNYYRDLESGWFPMTGTWTPSYVMLSDSAQSATMTWDVPAKYRVVSWELYDQYYTTKYAWAYQDLGKSVKFGYGDLSAVIPNPPGSAHLVPVCMEIRYNLSYDAGGGSWSSEPPDEEGIKYTASKTAAANDGLSWEGHTLQKNLLSNTGKSIAFGSAISGSALGVTAGTTNITLTAQWTVNQYDLTLTRGAGIAKICYKVNGASDYTAVTESTTVKVSYGTTWYAYAVPAAGYSYSATSIDKPVSGTMGTAGAAFAPVGAIKKNYIHFDGNDETSGSMDDMTCEYGKVYNLTKNAFRKTGYDFVVWDGSNGRAYDDGTLYFDLSDENGVTRTLTARWNPISCTITFDPQGGQCSETSRSVNYGSQLGPCPAATKDPYEFLGWFDDSVSTAHRYTQTSIISSDIALYAHWSESPKQYEIKVVADPTKGGTVSGGGKVNLGSSTTISVAANTGYTFTQWNDGNQEAERTITNVRADATYTAKCVANSYALEFVAEPGTLVDPSQRFRTITYDSPYGELPKVTPQDGMKFYGWYDDPSAGNQVTADTIVKSTAALQTLYAHYGELTYDIAYETNGGEIQGSYVTSYKPGVGATLPTDVTKSKNDFGGWFADSALAGERVYKIATTDTGDKTFYAKWIAQSNNVIYASGDWCVDRSYTNRYARYTSVTLADETYKRTGYKQDGWDTDPNGGTRRNRLCGTYTLNADATFYPYWMANEYTIKLDPNGGTGTSKTLPTATYDKAVTLPANTYTCEGHDFMGWATSATGASVYEDGATVSNLTAVAGGTVTLYAKWQKKWHYTIHFEPNATTNIYGAMADMSNCVSGDEIALSPCAYTNLVSVFGGWAETPNGPVWCDGKTNIVYNAASDGEVKTLYAVWPGLNEWSTNVVLTSNAVLTAEQKGGTWGWKLLGKNIYCQVPNVAEKQEANMTMNVYGPGVVRFKWKTENWGGGVNNVWATFGTNALPRTFGQWEDIVFAIEKDGLQTVVWSVGAVQYSVSGEAEPKMSVSEVRWNPGEQTRYNITVNAGKGGNATGGGEDLLVGTTANLLAKPSTGYEFKEWSDGCADASRAIVVVSNATYAAVFSPVKITVSYAGNGGTGGSTASQAFTYGVAGTIAANGFVRQFAVSYNPNGGSVNPSSATAASAFQHWSDTASGTEKYAYAPGQAVTNPCGSTGGEVTLYARWQDGTVTLPTPIRTGQAFGGWYTAQTGGTRVDGAGENYRPTNNVTLYAQWTANTYTIRFNKNADDATSSMDDLPCTYGTETNLTANAFARPDHDFMGWATNETGGVVYTNEATVVNLTDQQNGEVTLYAVWQEALSELSKAVGLTNANLIAGTNSTEIGKWTSRDEGEGVSFGGDGSGKLAKGEATMSMAVNGPGTVLFDWKKNSYNTNYWAVEVKTNGVIAITDLEKPSEGTNTISVLEGSVTITWCAHHKLSLASFPIDVLIKHISWIPNAAAGSGPSNNEN